MSIANSIAAQRANTSSDSSTFEAAATLMSDDATKCSTADSTYHSASLSIRTGGTGGKAASHDEREKKFFHGMESDKIHLKLFTIFMKQTAKF